MTKEAIYVGVDVAKDTLDVAASISLETHQFPNDLKGTSRAVSHIASLQQAGVVLEVTGNLEMPLAA